MHATGQLFVISAPSGAGKTSLVRELVKSVDGIGLSISHTTRPRRPGEEDGRDYHFVSQDTFRELIAADAFLEHAQVFDNFYGTSKDEVSRRLNAGEDVILEIDWQGARQIRQTWKQTLSIFILPPSLEALKDRLTLRGQDDEQVIARRMQAARQEMAHYDEYDFVIINDVFAEALDELRAIVVAERLRLRRQQQEHRRLIDALLKDS
jgi:guanylate kinase